MAAEPKHREVSRELRAEIAAGKYQAAERLPSEAQLVRRFGISRPTAARALLDLQRDGLIERRAGSGTYLRDTAQPVSARQLGLLVPERGTTEIFELICGELSSLARAHDFALLFGGTGGAELREEPSAEHARSICQRFVEQRVLGVFFAPFEAIERRAEVNRQLTEALAQAGIPVVLLDRDLVDFPQRSDFDLVSTDNLAGGFLLAEHLIKLGSRRIAFLARPGSAPSVDVRIAGVREAQVRQLAEVPADWVLSGDPENADFVRQKVVKGHWDAVICANDLTAAQLLRSLEKARVRVPADLRLVGFDDARFASLLGTSLTTMHQPCREIAVTAFYALLDRLSDPTRPARTVLLSPRLVVRESCGTYAG